MNYGNLDLAKLIPNMLEASAVTLEVFFLTLLFALPLGLLVAFGRMSRHRFLRWPVQAYQAVMRGTPLILQLLFVYFGPFYIAQGMGITGFKFDRFTACIVAFVLNYAAYFAEIYRAGIESIPVGQMEAAKVLGMTRWQTYRRIIIPQVIKRILPPMSNEFMTLVKDTALAQTIGVAELFRLAQTAQTHAFSTVPLVIAGVFYFVMNYLVGVFFNLAEKKLSYYR